MATDIEPRPSIPENRRSGGSAWDDCTLELERVRDMVDALNELIVGDSEVEAHSPNLITPICVLRMEVDYLDAAIHALERGWTDPDDEKPAEADKGERSGLRRAAEHVIRLYRAPGWDALAGETDGGYKPLPELEEALGALETALDVVDETDPDSAQ
jgi:hypothetical protein